MKQQRGFSAIIVILLLLVGIGGALFIFNNPFNLITKADTEIGVKFTGKFVVGDSTTSRQVFLTPNYPFNPKPTKFRVANSLEALTDLNNSQVFKYFEASDPQSSFAPSWALSGPVGERATVYVQFLVDGKWTNPVSRSILLSKSENTQNFKISCPKIDSNTNGKSTATLSWNTSDLTKIGADSITIAYYNLNNGQIYYIDQTEPQQTSESISLPQMSGKYALFATAVNSLSLTPKEFIKGTSEIVFSCANTPKDKQVDKSSIDGYCMDLLCATSIDQICPSEECTFRWKATNPTLYELSVWTAFPDDTNSAAKVDYYLNPEARERIYPAAFLRSLKPNHMYNLQVRALVPNPDPMNVDFTDNVSSRSNFFTSSFSVQVNPYQISCTGNTNNGQVQILGREAFTKDYIVDITDDVKHFLNNDGIWISKEVHGKTTTDLNGFSSNPVIGAFPKPNTNYYIRAFEGTYHTQPEQLRFDGTCKAPISAINFNATCSSFSGTVLPNQQVHFWLYNTWCTLNPNMCQNNKDLPTALDDWNGYFLGQTTADSNGKFEFNPQNSSNSFVTIPNNHLNAKSKLYSGVPRTISAMWVDQTGFGLAGISSLTCNP